MLRLLSEIIAIAICFYSMATLGMANPATPSVNTYCGGVVSVSRDYPATINYKLNEEYGNNEQCVWTIRVNDDQSNAFRFVKKESNFEQRFDFLQLSSFRASNLLVAAETKTFGNVNEQEEVDMTAPVVFVVFSTDDSNTGTGFSLEIEAIGSSRYNYLVNDFFSDEEVGNNTSLLPYKNNMFSTFVISPTNVESLEMEVIYSTESIDYISVLHCQRNGGRIMFLPYGRLSGTGNRHYTVHVYTTLVILFTSDVSIIGRGVEFHWAAGTENGSTRG